MRRSVLLLSTALALGSGLQAVAQASLTEEDVKQLALDAILENPDIIMEAIAILQAREAAEAEAQAQAAVTAQADRLLDDPNAPVLGNPQGDVTVVEFFDYNCPYCRRAGAEVEAMIAADPNVRVVYREWPILGDGSIVAARAALAARAQDKYLEMHEAMMSAESRLDEGQVMRIAEEIGLDMDKLRQDMNGPEVDEHLTSSTELARALGFNGTPSFVVGEQLSYGALSAEELLALVSEARGTGDQ